jgi:hypothetical protein
VIGRKGVGATAVLPNHCAAVSSRLLLTSWTGTICLLIGG